MPKGGFEPPIDSYKKSVLPLNYLGLIFKIYYILASSRTSIPSVTFPWLSKATARSFAAAKLSGSVWIHVDIADDCPFTPLSITCMEKSSSGRKTYSITGLHSLHIRTPFKNFSSALTPLGTAPMESARARGRTP